MTSKTPSERRKGNNDRRQKANDRRRDIRILSNSGEPRPDRREGPRRRGE